MPQEHKLLHILTELFSVTMMVPFYLYLTRNYDLSKRDTQILYFLSIGSLLVDGYFAYQWLF